MLGNTPASARSNATAPGASRALTTCGNTPRRSTSTKTSPSIRLLPPGPGSRGRSGPIGCEPVGGEPEPRLPEASELRSAATPSRYRRQASRAISSIGSAYSPRDEVRRRPPPLVMATDPRARLSLESYRGATDGQFPFRPISPSDYSTPTSATFSTSQGSPRWGSGVASPTSSHSRSQSMYAAGSRTPGRRLSVPSSGNPFQVAPAPGLGRPLFGPGPINSSNSGVFASSNNSSLLSSPTVSSAGWSRRESMSNAADEAWRRRTWHPDTREYSQGGSRLSNVITPSQFQTSAAPLPIVNPAQQTTFRLPGIESFDQSPGSPPRRIPSPMAIDSDAANPRVLMPAADSAAEDRRNVAQWDMGLHRGLTRLEIASSTPPRDSAGAWASEVNQAVQAQAEQARVNPPTVRSRRRRKSSRSPRTATRAQG